MIISSRTTEVHFARAKSQWWIQALLTQVNSTFDNISIYIKTINQNAVTRTTHWRRLGSTTFTNKEGFKVAVEFG